MRVNLLFSYYYLLYRENRRKMELTDLLLLEYLPMEGLTLYYYLVILL